MSYLGDAMDALRRGGLIVVLYCATDAHEVAMRGLGCYADTVNSSAYCPKRQF